MNIKDKNFVVWDALWNSSTFKASKLDFERESVSLRWLEIKRIILEKYGGFKGLNVIELGSGVGTISLLFALQGSNVYVLDYSKKALEKCKRLFSYYNEVPNIILCDALKIDKKLFNMFDISMSFGLAEHFKGDNRFNIIKIHFILLKRGGLTFISVPNKINPIYRLWKFLKIILNRWPYGEEYPFTIKELYRICLMLNRIPFFLRDSILSSINLIFPSSLSKLKMILNKFEKANKKKGKIFNFLCYIFSYSIVLVSKK